MSSLSSKARLNAPGRMVSRKPPRSSESELKTAACPSIAMLPSFAALTSIFIERSSMASSLLQRIVDFDAKQLQNFCSFVRVKHGLNLKLARAKNHLLLRQNSSHPPNPHNVCYE